MTYEDVRHAHTRWSRSIAAISRSFSTVEDDTLREFLGDHFNHLSQQVRDHGDGYTLRGVPRRIKDITAAEDVVLILGRCPGLGGGSVFDPYEPLTGVDFWAPALRSTVRIPGVGERQLRFLIWQDRSTVHGEDSGRARRNERLLRSEIEGLGALIDSQAAEARRLLVAWANWMNGLSPRRQFVVVTHTGDPLGESGIAELAGLTSPPIRMCLWGRGNQRRGITDMVMRSIESRP